MKKNLLFVLVLMVATCLGGLLYEGTAAAQNSNSSTMGRTESARPNMGRRRHRRHWRRHGRRHGRRSGKTGNANK